MAAERGNEVAIAALKEPVCPEEVRYLVDWSYALVGRSGVSDVGFSPLTYSTIAHWSELMDTPVEPHEVEALLLLDAAMRDHGEEEEKKEEPVQASEPAWPTRKAEPVLIPSD